MCVNTSKSKVQVLDCNSKFGWPCLLFWIIFQNLKFLPPNFKNGEIAWKNPLSWADLTSPCPEFLLPSKFPRYHWQCISNLFLLPLIGSCGSVWWSFSRWRPLLAENRVGLSQREGTVGTSDHRWRHALLEGVVTFSWVTFSLAIDNLPWFVEYTFLFVVPKDPLTPSYWCILFYHEKLNQKKPSQMYIVPRPAADAGGVVASCPWHGVRRYYYGHPLTKCPLSRCHHPNCWSDSRHV